jgi:WD40 repeat protein
MTDETQPCADETSPSDDDPQVFAVQKNLAGDWTFNRRDFLTAAAAATLVGTVAGCGSESGPTPVVTKGPAASPTSELSPVELSAACRGLKAHDEAITVLAISPDGAHGSAVNGLAFTSDGETLVSGDAGGLHLVWSLPDTEDYQPLPASYAPVSALAVTPDGTLLASGSSHSGIKLFDLQEQKEIKTITTNRAIMALAISPDGTLLVSGGSASTIQLWSLPDGEAIKTVNADDNESGSITALAITPDGSTLFSGGEDGLIMLWSLPDAEPLVSLNGHSKPIWYLVVSEDGKQLISASIDGVVNYWSLPDGDLLDTIDFRFTLSDTLPTLAIAPDQSLLVTALQDGGLQLWSLPDGELTGCLVDSDANEEGAELVDVELDSGQTVSMPVGVTIPLGAVCTCNTVTVCSCVGHTCSCVGHTSGGSGGHYWFPN